MKKKISALLCAAMIFASASALSGCSDKEKDKDTAKSSASDDNSSASEDIKETQPDPLDPESTEAPEETEPDTSEAEATETETEEPSTEETSENEDEQAPAAEGIVLKVDENTPDSELISTAQKLFETACTTNWNYHVGCPYTLDYETYVQNRLGWQYYLITDSSIETFEDVVADYQKVFSDKYGNDLNELYLEKEGKVYALDGARGSNVYYLSSKVTAVKERSGNEIFFEVEDYYSGDDFSGDKSVTEKREFSAVISENGSWRAGKFTLPY